MKPELKDYSFNRRLCGFDIETAGDKNEFVLACFYGDGIERSFTSKDEVVKFLESGYLQNYVIVATNLAFDFFGTFLNYKNWNICERSGIIYKASYYPGGRKNNAVHFYDTLNYYKASVEDLGIILKIPKLPHPTCFQRRPRNNLEWMELRAYCFNDAKISYEFFKQFIIRFHDEHKLKLKPTAASMSLALFKKEYLKEEYWPHEHWINKIIMKGYYGGRTEVFKRGTFFDVNCYDINSLYPYAMTLKYPDPRTMKYTKQGSASLIEKFEGVSYIEGFMPPHYIPPLPCRKDNKLIFPVSAIKGWYNHNEIRNAYKYGFSLYNIGECVFYTGTCEPFKEFVLDMRKKRELEIASKNPLEVMTKLCMNSLYGKFGFNYMQSTKLIHDTEITAKDFIENKEYKILDNFFEFINEDCELMPDYALPIWASYCTSYARIKLYETLGRRELWPHICYCDTDSIFLKDGITIPSSKVLGDFKHEYNVPKAVFIRPKFYYAKYPKAKGLKLKNFEMFIDAISSKSANIQRFVKIRSSEKSTIYGTHGKLTVNQILDIRKELRLEDDKRKWYEKLDINKSEDSSPIFI